MTDHITPLLSSPVVGYAHHRVILDTYQNPIDYEFIEVNPAFAKLTGLQAERLIGKTLRELFPQIESEAVDWVSHFEDIAVNGGARSFEHFSEPMGRWYQVHVHSHEAGYLTAVCVDVTDRRIAEAEQRAILQTTCDGFFMADTDARIIDVNPAYCDMVGYSREELLQMRISDLDAQETPEDVATRIQQLQQHGFVRFQAQHRKKDGSLLDIEVSVTTLKEFEGKMVVLVRDITEIQQTRSALAESGELLNNLAAQIPGVIYQYRFYPDGRNCFPFASTNIESIYEVTPEAVRHDGSKVLSRLHPDDHDAVVSKIKASAENLSVWEDEYRVVLPKRGERWLGGIAQPERLTDGSVLWHGYIADITERKLAEQQLTLAERKLRATVDGLSAHIVVLDEAGNIILTNKAYRDFAARNETDPSLVSEGTNYLAVSETAFGEDADVAKAFAKGIREVISGQRPSFELEYPCHSPQAKRWFTGRVTPLVHEGGHQVIVSHDDITERKLAEISLEIERTRLAGILKGTNVGTWEWNVQTGATSFNERWADMIGYRLEELAPISIQTWMGFAHPDDLKQSESLLQRHFKGELEYYEFESRMRHRDGSWIWVLDRGRLVSRSADGKPLMMMGTHQDITERKQKEEKLRLLNEQLEATTAIAKEMAEQAEAASRSKSEFLANMSHEIRTPLNGVIGFTDLLRDTPLSTVQHHYVENANISGHALLGIINDILDFSKIEAGMLELEAIRTDMVELFENSVDIVKLAAAKKNLEILLDLDPAMPRFAKVDPIRLKQILANLLSNAIKFTKDGEVELKVRYQPVDKGHGTFSISVRDTGIGISESQKTKLFKAFSQGDSSTNRKFGGTGLGLIISDMIARKMGCKIEIDSEPGEGSTFHFDLTVHTEHGDARLPGDLSRVQRCLVIDDNANNRMILERLLAGWGVVSECCDNGLEALKLLDVSSEFDAIICDYHMPYINGLETIRMIRQKLHRTPEEQPILLLHSSAEDLTLHEHCAELGVRFCITKPVKQEKLLECLSLLHQAPSQAMAVRSAANGAESDHSAATQAKAPTLSVLVAEDVHLNMLLIKSLLARVLPHAKVIEAENGRIALEAYQQQTPDLILMDVQMPEMDGFETTMAIRELEKDTGIHVPIVALTAGAIKEEEERCLRAGMDGFLTKPIETQKLSELFQTMKIGKS